MLKVGFIGLGNVGAKLAGSLLRNGVDLIVRDLHRNIAQPFLDAGASWADSPREMAGKVDILITCLPSPAASANVMEAEDGVLPGLGHGKVWAEMSRGNDVRSGMSHFCLCAALKSLTSNCKSVRTFCSAAAMKSLSLFTSYNSWIDSFLVSKMG